MWQEMSSKLPKASGLEVSESGFKLLTPSDESTGFEFSQGIHVFKHNTSFRFNFCTLIN